ncbi:MAG: GNVR domain-containing protein [Deferrisomatales bacterium]|nr:GNVR domain-containing protein [Deferrisomatales bacterium]
MNETHTTVSVKGLIRRRKRIFWVCFVPIFAAAAVAAVALPSIYQSKATILIEGQQIPRSYITTTVTSYVEERLHVITQRVLSRQNLEALIEQFGLYPEMRGRYTGDEIRQRMRKAIQLETISADVKDQRIGRTSEATVAFTISYEGKDPETVQKVASVLADYYLAENLRTRAEEASGTTAFFEQQQQEIQRQIEELERRISQFKKENLGILPENTRFNIDVAQRLGRDLDGYQMRIQTLEDRRLLLRARLAGVEPYLPVVAIEDTEKQLVDRLREQRLHLATLQASFSDAHPDMVRVRRVIAELETQVAERDRIESKIEHLAQLRATLAGLQGRYGQRHPDIQRLTREIRSLSAEIAAEQEGLTAAETDAARPVEEPDNPVYLDLQTQIASVDLEISGLRELIRKTQRDLADYEERIRQAPLVEQEYSALTRDHQNARRRYDEISAKLMEARTAQGLEQSEHGERFTLADAPSVPQNPYKPNRLAIVLLGLTLGLGAGVGAAAARESLDRSVKVVDELGDLTQAPVLSVLPLIRTAEERRRRRLRRAGWAVGVAGLCGVGLTVVHRSVMPLDTLVQDVWLPAIQSELAKHLPLDVEPAQDAEPETAKP